MYQADNFRVKDAAAFEYSMPEDRDFKLLQLTDLHLGFGLFSKKKDRKALDAVSTLIGRTKPDMIVLTGDSVFPYLPKAGTLNNRRQMIKLLDFLDGFGVPYAFVMGNHDTEMGSMLKREELGELMKTGKYSIFAQGPENIFGTGNYFIDLVRGSGAAIEASLILLDSNMYGGGWFYGGFDRIHPDQSEWAVNMLADRKAANPDMYAMMFFHMPVREFKEAYELMKLGDRSVTYNFGSVGEAEDYFGISKLDGDIFAKALESGAVKAMFCGHDHLNTLSLTYKGIRMTYGMSIDCLGYKGIYKQEIQRGGTLITLHPQGGFDVCPVPLTTMVTRRVRGVK